MFHYSHFPKNVTPIVAFDFTLTVDIVNIGRIPFKQPRLSWDTPKLGHFGALSWDTLI